MLLAAGFGRRMVPVTLFRAKPSLPFLNRPLLLRTLDWLEACGVDEVVVNLHHRPESLLALLTEGAAPLDPAAGPFRVGALLVHVSLEDRLLGTSGGLKRAAHHFRDAGTVLCVNADFVCEIDLGEALRTHHASGLAATLVLASYEPNCGHTPVLHNGHRVYSFGEGTAPPHANQRGMFTGIHLLEPAMLDELPDGASEFLPALYRPMVEKGRGPGVFLARQRWVEVGTARRYLDEQVRALAGAPYDRHRQWPSGLRIAPGSFIAPSAQTSTLALVGDECHIGEGAVLGRGTLLGCRVEVGPGARLSHCVVLHGARVGAQASIRESVVGPATAVPPGMDLAGEVVDSGPGGPAPSPDQARPARFEGGAWHAAI